MALLTSCNLKQNPIYPEYYKRENLVYADPFIYESIIKIDKDSFIFANYKKPFNAHVSKGSVEIKNGRKILSVKESKSISLNTGQPIGSLNIKNSIHYEMTKSNQNEIQIKKYVDNIIDSTFRYKPYKFAPEINDLEKWFFEENTSSIKNFWTKENLIEPPPPKPEITEYEEKLRNEVKELNEERKDKIQKLISHIAEKCDANQSDSLIIRMELNPNGKIDSYNLLKFSRSSATKVECIEELLNNKSINLGEIKIIPSARNGTKPRKINYTLPIN